MDKAQGTLATDAFRRRQTFYSIGRNCGQQLLDLDRAEGIVEASGGKPTRSDRLLVRLRAR
jgi:hypothetical protein